MADTQTKVSDVIVPEVFLPYVIERTAELSAFFQSGIVASDPVLDEKAQDGGQTINMPFWQDLTGDDQVLDESSDIETKKIGADKDIAVFHNRGDGWATTDLSKYLSGDDPMQAIGDLVADYWRRKHEAQLISSLKGVFAAGSMSGLVSDIHDPSGSPGSTNKLNGSTLIDAKQLMGDAKQKLVAIAVHSAVEAHLLKNDLIDYVPDSEGKSMLRVFQGLRLLMDDTLPTETVSGKTVYTSFLFGEGAFGYGVSRDNPEIEGGFGTWQLEYARQARVSGGITEMINRKRFFLHPRGVKWTSSSMAGLSPTNAELETAANWTRVYELKNIRLVKIRHNID
jgi:hypothetical protein